MYNLSLSNNINFDWIKFVQGVFDNCGHTYVWETQTLISDIWLKQVIKVKLYTFIIHQKVKTTEFSKILWNMKAIFIF